MTSIGEKLKAQALELSEEDRAELAHALIASLERDSDEAVEEAWDVELRRRLKEIESGRVRGRSAEDVLPEARDSGE